MIRYTGHGEKTGGLQAHSVGDSYPFCVVGTMHRLPKSATNCTELQATSYTRYYILNLITNERWYFKGRHRDYCRTFVCSIKAHACAVELANGITNPETVKLED